MMLLQINFAPRESLPLMSQPARVLAIHAHPDDVEFQCAATLALLRRAGHHVTIATMSPGDCGSAEHDNESIAAIRRAEAAAAAALIGAEYVCLEFRDLSIVNDLDARRRVVECLRRNRAEIVLTAPPADYLSDHEITSVLVRDACFAAPIANYKTCQWEPAPPLPTIPTLYFVDPIGGVDRDLRAVAPDFYVDVSSVFETKAAMLACHSSQRNWLLKQHGIDEYLHLQRDHGARRGAEIGVAYAEGFRQYRGHPYPTENRLISLLGQDGRGRTAAGTDDARV